MSTTQTTVVLTLPWPPTLNRYYHYQRGGRVLTGRGRQYRTKVLAVVRRAYPRLRPMTGRVRLLVRAFPPDRHKRDLDNLAKSLWDALEHAGVYADDSQIDHYEITRCDVVKAGEVSVVVEEVEPGE